MCIYRFGWKPVNLATLFSSYRTMSECNSWLCSFIERLIRLVLGVLNCTIMVRLVLTVRRFSLWGTNTKMKKEKSSEVFFFTPNHIYICIYILYIIYIHTRTTAQKTNKLNHDRIALASTHWPIINNRRKIIYNKIFFFSFFFKVQLSRSFCSSMALHSTSSLGPFSSHHGSVQDLQTKRTNKQTKGPVQSSPVW